MIPQNFMLQFAYQVIGIPQDSLTPKEKNIADILVQADIIKFLPRKNYYVVVNKQS